MNVVSWTLTILSGNTDSEEINLGASGANKAYTINVFAPATLTGTVKVYVASEPGGTFVPQQSNATDISIPQGVATLLSPLVAGAFRLTSGSAEGGDRVFTLKGIEIG